MTLSESPGNFKPFANLKTLIDRKSLCLPSRPAPRSVPVYAQKCDWRTEKRLFLEAMAEVVPIPLTKRMSKRYAHRGPPVRRKMAGPDPIEKETLQRLHNLVHKGEGFVIADTAEYIEGRGFGVHPRVVRRLHRGDFSIQAHIDLHGLTVDHAQTSIDRFLHEAIKHGRRAVLIVHGRGLCSPRGPVLKTKVQEWLTAGIWRKWILAFASARACDGGTGATYVLLRANPLSKKEYKRQNRAKCPAGGRNF